MTPQVIPRPSLHRWWRRSITQSTEVPAGAVVEQTGCGGIDFGRALQIDGSDANLFFGVPASAEVGIPQRAAVLAVGLVSRTWEWAEVHSPYKSAYWPVGPCKYRPCIARTDRLVSGLLGYHSSFLAGGCRQLPCTRSSLVLT